jgi:hypothetical protein
MIDSIQARLSRLNQDVQNLINWCNSEKEVIEVEFDVVRRDCEIFTQHIETNSFLSTEAIQGHEQQIQILTSYLRKQEPE